MIEVHVIKSMSGLWRNIAYHGLIAVSYVELGVTIISGVWPTTVQ